MLRQAFSIALLSILTGCAYLNDRGRDACDVITVSIETGHANASLQIAGGTMGVGLTQGKGVGSRSGALGVYEYAEVNLMIFGAKRLIPSEADLLRGKGYDYSYLWNPWDSCDEVETEIHEGGKFNAWQIELAAVLGIGARIGVNLAEFADLILGVFQIDILDDDIHTIEKREQEAMLHCTD